MFCSQLIIFFIDALTEIVECYKIPENESRLEEARDNAGNDMLKMMQIVFPLATQMQMKVIQRYAFYRFTFSIHKYSINCY